MRIFFTNDAPIIKYGIGQAFADLGHQVHFANVSMDPSWLAALNTFHPDMLFTEAGWGIMNRITPVLRERRLPLAYWAIEDPPLFNYLSLPYARIAKLVFTTCEEMIPVYRQHGIRAELMMFACHPAFHRQVPSEHRFNHDIAFVGNNYIEYGDRLQAVQHILEPLINSQYRIKIYGNEWWLDKNRPYFISPEVYGGYLANESLPALCSSVPIILGLHSVTDSKTMMSMRTFEVLGSRGFYLTQWTPAVENLFKNHHHLVWTRSAEETMDLVSYYLKNPAARDRIAHNGQEEVYSKHTYHQRVQEILPLMESSLLPNPIVVHQPLTRIQLRYGKRVTVLR